MKRQHTSFYPVLRFRRWSRKAYAVFVSIQRAVTIGALQVHLVERLQNKNVVSIAKIFAIDCAEDTLCTDSDAAIASDNIDITQFISMCVCAKEATPAHFLELYYYNIYLKRDAFCCFTAKRIPFLYFN